MVVDCEVVVRLWGRLLGVVGVWGGAVLERAEMAHGMGGTGDGTVIRNRLGFTLRSVVQSMRGVRVGGIDETVDRLWSLFLRCLKKAWRGMVRGVLVGGVLGTLVDGAVVWGPLFDDVGYRYWDLFD